MEWEGGQRGQGLVFGQLALLLLTRYNSLCNIVSSPLKLSGGGSVRVPGNAFLNCLRDEEPGIPTGVRVILLFTQECTCFCHHAVVGLNTSQG